MEPLPRHQDGSVQNSLSAAEVQFFDYLLQRLVNETSEGLPKNSMDPPPLGRRSLLLPAQSRCLLEYHLLNSLARKMMGREPDHSIL